ncbi:MAG: 1-acyl-sn-glycerol-3-phosphate acyltransferase [Sandaracinus sp.]|nr:1-acyl-sn-glycerol-3-phosphate acyltransferase [Sandaracinus sp.]
MTLEPFEAPCEARAVSSTPPPSEAQPSRAFRLVAKLARLLLGAFFRRVEVVGLENVPTEGGVILVSWHPNGIVDPALLFDASPRPVIFGARHGLFKVPIFGAILRATGAVPIFRAGDDGSGDPEKRRAANAKSLDALARAVTGGGVTCLFPEGDSHDQPGLLRLKTGLARFYYRARELRPDAPPQHRAGRPALRREARVSFERARGLSSADPVAQRARRHALRRPRRTTRRARARPDAFGGDDAARRRSRHRELADAPPDASRAHADPRGACATRRRGEPTADDARADGGLRAHLARLRASSADPSGRSRPPRRAPSRIRRRPSRARPAGPRARPRAGALRRLARPAALAAGVLRLPAASAAHLLRRDRQRPAGVAALACGARGRETQEGRGVHQASARRAALSGDVDRSRRRGRVRASLDARDVPRHSRDAGARRDHRRQRLRSSEARWRFAT